MSIRDRAEKVQTDNTESPELTADDPDPQRSLITYRDAVARVGAEILDRVVDQGSPYTDSDDEWYWLGDDLADRIEMVTLEMGVRP